MIATKLSLTTFHESDLFCAGDTVLFWLLETWNVFKECRQDEVDIHLARVDDSATTTCTKALITYIRMIVAAPNVLVVYTFGTDFH